MLPTSSRYKNKPRMKKKLRYGEVNITDCGCGEAKDVLG
jgi:hypothetical protein